MNADLINFFEVEELEQRLEYSWGGSVSCTVGAGGVSVQAGGYCE